MNVQLLIDAVMQQSTVFIAHLATAGGARAPLAHVADQVFVDLSKELQAQGVKKKLIADMFGLTLRTYHRRIKELSESETVSETTVWKAVLDYINEHEPVSRARITDRFRYDDAEVVIGVLTDLVHTGLCYSSGSGDGTTYRIADDADFADEGEDAGGKEHLVWLNIYRNGPTSLREIAEATTLTPESVHAAVRRLAEVGRVQATKDDLSDALLTSSRFDVAVGSSNGWEAAVLDHYQAVVTAIMSKLRSGGRGSRQGETAGGATFSMDVGAGHPLREEATALLSETRARIEALRDRIDKYNEVHGTPDDPEQVVFYLGQYIKASPPSSHTE